MSAKDALLKFSQRQLDKLELEMRPRRKNSKPELQVIKELLAWLRANRFSCDVVESKAVYSVRAGRYLHSQATPGFSDIAGSCPNGLGCFIEAKAPGRLRTLRDAQRIFLTEKIGLGCFAVVVDSAALLEKLWLEFAHRQLMDPQLARAFLLRQLPPQNDDDFFNHNERKE